MQGLNQFCADIHDANVDKGFYEIDPSIDRLLMLIVGEVSEAHEALRKGLTARLDIFETYFKDHFNSAQYEELFKDTIKDTFEDEIADTIIRLFDLCGFKGIDIEKHIELKLKYNKKRPHKHGKNF